MDIKRNFSFNKTAFINGKIYTVDDKKPIAESVVVIGNTIIFVGSNSEAKEFIDSKTEVIDLKGKLMLPGFIDSHVHFVKGGFYLLGVNLRNAGSENEFKEILRNYIADHKGEWITGGSWDHELWKSKELPKKEWIDDFSQDTPVLIYRNDLHTALANSYALKLADINKTTADPDGGIIERDEASGEPTGILKDLAVDMVTKVIPEPSQELYIQAVRKALEEAKKNGITSIQDITLPNEFPIYQKLEREGELTCRIYSRLPIQEYKNFMNLNIQHGFGSPQLKIGSLKAFADGSLGAGTALFFEPYANDASTSGLAMDIVTDGRLSRWAVESDLAKLQLSIHAIGDKANNIILDLFEEIIKKNPEWDRRFRIEHAQHLQYEDIKRFAELGVIASMQPYHLFDDGPWVERKIGKKRLKYTYAFKSLLEEGVKVCFGSDWYVAPMNVILGIYAAVTRHTAGGEDLNGWIPDQKISVEQAVKCYTINSAYAAYEENIKGTIEPGKLADMVVLSEDIFSIPPESIKNVYVDMTIFNGKIIYQSRNS